MGRVAKTFQGHSCDLGIRGTYDIFTRPRRDVNCKLFILPQEIYFFIDGTDRIPNFALPEESKTSVPLGNYLVSCFAVHFGLADRQIYYLRAAVNGLCNFGNLSVGIPFNWLFVLFNSRTLM